jgi:membrane protein YdbS with pleckstrin-like domain
MQLTTSQTKVCPFCAETILVAAIKCRYCGEFLNTQRAKAIVNQPQNAGDGQQADNADGSQGEQSQQPNEVSYSGGPSLWAMTAVFIKGGIVLAVAVTLILWHIERIAALQISAENAVVVGKYRILLGLGLGLVVGVILFYKALKLRMTHYTISPDRIEYGEGIFDRKVDNLDMFRIVDIKLRRNFFDCVVGVGTVFLTTTDKSHPEFVFEKVKNSRELYDTIKKASLSADRRTNVIHME